jgi:hypothetical protein
MTATVSILASSVLPSLFNVSFADQSHIRAVA